VDKEANEARRFQEQAQAEAVQVMAEQALNKSKKREKSVQYRLELERQIRYGFSSFCADEPISFIF
jgi:hypothetical protein